MEGRPIAEAIAAVLIEGFNRHYRLFRETSAQAKVRFERGAWAEAQLAVQERIRFYDERVRENVQRLRTEFDLDALDAAAWREVKLRFIGLLVDHHQPELAETFFNSVITRILRRTYSNNDLIFVRGRVDFYDYDVVDFFPYPESPRFSNRPAPEDGAAAGASTR